MTWVGDLRKLASRTREERRLLAEAFAWLCPLQLMVRWITFRRICELFSLDRGEGSDALTEEQAAEVARIEWAVRAAAARAPLATSCVGQALAVMAMLRRRGIPGTLYVGVAREGGGIAAHAWLRSGSAIVAGEQGHERFSVVDRLRWMPG